MKTRTIKVFRKYGSTKVEHCVTESDNEIAITMSLEPFLAAVLEHVGNPFAITTKAALARKIQAGIDAEIQRMKDSTVYKAVESA